MIEGAAGGNPAAGVAVAHAAYGERPRSIIGETGYQLLEQRQQRSALAVVESLEEVIELIAAFGQDPAGRGATRDGQVEGTGPSIGARAALEQAVGLEAVHHLGCARLGDPEHSADCSIEPLG